MVAHVSSPNNESPAVRTQEDLNSLMTDMLINDIYQFLLEHAKGVNIEE